MKNISRRRFISGSASVVGAGISLQMLTSCGDSATSGENSPTDSLAAPDSDQLADQISELPSDLQLVQRFPQVLVSGNLRLPISLALSSGIISASSDFKFPQTLSAKVIDLSTDKVLIENISAKLHGAEISLPYYPFYAEITTAGNYSLIVAGGPYEGTAFSVLERGQVSVPGTGDSLPSFDTPTFADHRQVEPICTRQPKPCPFHEVTLSDALKLGVPVAYIVGTPAHCSTGTCSPALDGLIEVAARVGDRAVFIHAEIYADEAATVIAPAIKALGLTFEPTLFIVDMSSKIVKRLDAVFDSLEISDALASVGIS
ncbi:MAG: hypothetical protein F2884_05435 [Actinobacteria bacterium]|uniref:Unannotated protein n=1 Tax=freshwater metagenome TaxID=449393 RepID=A0A6J7PL74_9ZZZZ|nr:hypothetical protein [Actinomycetota bacterium]